MSEIVRGKKCCACCPVCGTLLQKSAVADTETRCSNCGSGIVILVEDGVVTTFETRRQTAETRQKFNKRIKAYTARTRELVPAEDKN